MKKTLLLLGIVTIHRVYAQCPAAATLVSIGGTCPNAAELQVTVGGANGGSGANSGNISQINWYQGSTLINTATAPLTYTGVTVAGGNSFGTALNQFFFPNAICGDPNDDVYIADVNNSRIVEWTPGATSGIIVAGGNGAGPAANQFYAPYGLCRDASGNLYIADTYNHRVQKWAPGATSGITVAGGNGAGSAANQLNAPYGVTVDGNGNVYVADYNNNRIQEWAPGAVSGITVAGGNGQGAAANQLFRPDDVKVDANGNIFIADFANNRVQEWGPGATSGITVAGGNGSGLAANQDAGPTAIWLDAGGNVYVCDGGTERVQKWAPGATSGITVAGGNGQGAAANQLYYPDGLFVDANGNVFVDDGDNNRVQEWTLVAGPIDNTYNPLSAGVYSAVITTGGGCTMTSNTIVIDPVVTPQVTISTNSQTVNACTPVTFSADAVNGGNSPYYQWKVNGSNSGTNSPVFISTHFNSGDIISCVMTSSVACPTQAAAFSNSLGLMVNPLPPALLTTTGNACASDSLYVSAATPLAGITWYNNSSAVGSATASTVPSYSGTTVAGGNGAGSAPDQLNNPMGLALDGNGNVYVADMMNNRIEEWTPDATSGIVVAGGNGPGPAPNQLSGPQAVFVDATGNIYIAESTAIVKWAPGATSGVIVVGGYYSFGEIMGLYVDKTGNIYVASYIDQNVQKWAPGATSGTIVAGAGGDGSGPSQINSVQGIFVDDAGNLYVTDGGNCRVQKYPPGATNGIIVAGGNGVGSAANQLSEPSGVYVDGNGNVFVADRGNSRIQEWAPGATAGITVAGTTPGPAANQLAGPTDVTMDALGFLYIVDNGNNRVQKWGLGSAIDTAYKANAPGTWQAVLTTAYGCTITTSPIVINPILTPAVSISTPQTTLCAGMPAGFTAAATDAGAAPAFQWLVNGIAAGDNSPGFTDNTPGNGDVITCVLTSQAACANPKTATSNPVSLTVRSITGPSVSISASSTALCSGQPVTFSATLTNGGSSPSYQWQVDGVDAGSTTPAFTSSQLANGDTISCIVTNEAGCAPATSNSIAMTIYPLPVIAPGQEFDVSGGQGVVLQPVVTGDINSYDWTPATGLSDTTIANPLANPPASTIYTLEATTAQGCTASGPITVKVFGQVSIPAAFSPNNDGHNDIFYVLEGPQGSVIESFAVFDRWGQCLFQVHDVLPGDATRGWNGNNRGQPASPGTYVYAINLRLAGGQTQVYRGTVILVR